MKTPTVRHGKPSTVRVSLPEQLLPLRMLRFLDNLQGHHTPELVLWLFAHGVMVLYTPLDGSWLNMAESIQRILVRRAISGQNLQAPEQIIAWLEAVARAWNQNPTPFEWGGASAVPRYFRPKLNLIQNGIAHAN